MSTFYQHEPAYDKGWLPVGDIHTLYYEQYGNPAGKPALFVHGGPGSGFSFSNTAWFDPAVYRVVLFDQRGAGKSTPAAETRENTTWHLVSDIEALRVHLDISKWHLVFGGSWGSALSLVYAQTHPSKVGSMIIRGIFAGRDSEQEFHRGSTGAAMLFPEAYARYLEPLPIEDRASTVHGYWKLFQSNVVNVRRHAITEFCRWDFWTTQLEAPANAWDRLSDEKWCEQHAVLECHYFHNRIFMSDGELLQQENIDKIRHVPTTIIQGQYDICTPPQTAWDLHTKWPESTLHMVPSAGHTANVRPCLNTYQDARGDTFLGTRNRPVIVANLRRICTTGLIAAQASYCRSMFALSHKLKYVAVIASVPKHTPRFVPWAKIW